MSKELKSSNKMADDYKANGDPLEVRQVRLGGAPPSLSVEARLAVRNWASKEGSSCAVKVDGEAVRKG